MPGGRPKGSQNKNRNTGIIIAQRKGVSPLEFLLSVMDDEDNDLSVRMDAAKAATPYLHARLSQIAMDVDVQAQVTEIRRTVVTEPANG